MHTLTLFYDARCGLCSSFRHWLEVQPAYVHLEFLPYDSPAAQRRCPILQEMRADKEIVVMSDEGDLWQGAGAWAICLWALREYRGWSAKLASPALMKVARKMVLWISGNRIGLSHLLRLRSDAALAEEADEMICESGQCQLSDPATVARRGLLDLL